MDRRFRRLDSLARHQAGGRSTSVSVPRGGGGHRLLAAVAVLFGGWGGKDRERIYNSLYPRPMNARHSPIGIRNPHRDVMLSHAARRWAMAGVSASTRHWTSSARFSVLWL